MKNILINIPNLNKEQGGVYQYSLALLKILAKSNSEFSFFILCHSPDKDLKEIVYTTPNFDFITTKPTKYSSHLLLIYKILNRLCFTLKIKKRFIKKDLYDCIIKEYKIDIIHSPIQTIVIKDNVKNITTLHDVQEIHYPQFFTSTERANRAVNYKKAIDGADAVIVSYDHVKIDIITYFNKPENKIHTVLLDMQDLWYDNIKSRNSKVLKKFNLPKKYLLYPASTWEHKNHLRLIDAIKQTNNSDINLICTGHQTNYYTQNIIPFIKELGLDYRVKFIGIVTDEELYELYHDCEAVIVPTLYEAGSFPLMESILMGIPVICSNVTSLPETIGDDRFVFNPFDVDDISNKIKKIWNDEDYKIENRKNLEQQVEMLKNNRAASKILKIYNSL